MNKEVKTNKKIEQFKKENKKREIKNKKKANYHWIIKITIISFLLSFALSTLSETIIPSVNTLIGIILVIIFVGLGVLFDMIGIAVTTADVKVFHSMSSQKIKSARTAVKLQQNANKVSSFCNDVVGDICGIISGSAGVIIASDISRKLNSDLLITTLIITAIIASLTIGSKAIGKSIALNKSNTILYEFSKILSYFYNPKK
ncbi:MAG: hypothetical protein PHE54_00960 [Bacilli bacterium]|nr:hypothetical protein [Bacilli bacterium]